MRLSDRSYPHPVVGNKDDVQGAAFQAVKQASCDKEYFYLDVEIQCSSPAIQSLVKEKKAAFVVHVECTNTMFREATRFHDAKVRIQIPTTKLFDRFEVNVFACVLGPVSSYKVEGAHSDYGLTPFDLVEGDIIAVADGEDFYIESQDSLSRISSIMVIVESNKDTGPLEVDYNGERIAIMLSKRDSLAYKGLKSNEHLVSTLTSTIVFPVLMHALQMMKAAPDDPTYSKLRWHQNLCRRLEKDGVKGWEFDPLEIAQTILDLPVRRALAAGTSLMELGN